MTLPITESILRGELRPTIIQDVLDEKRMAEVMRTLRKLGADSDLLSIELSMKNALKGVVDLMVYDEDKKERTQAAKFSKPDRPSCDIRKQVVMGDVMSCDAPACPQMRMYAKVMELEVRRSLLAMMYLHRSAKDDAYTRTALKKLMRSIKVYCKEAANWTEHVETMQMVTARLTELYFSMVHTYQQVLDSGTLDYDNNFEDFVYAFRGEDPTEEEMERYNTQMRNRMDIGKDIVIETPAPQNGSHEPQKTRTRVDDFLDKVKPFDFLGLPKIKALGSEKKICSLVDSILDCTARACAMLDMLGLYEHIKKRKSGKYRKQEDYDKDMADVFQLSSKDAFKNYRLSLNPTNKNADKYGAYQYVETCKELYDKLLNAHE